MKLKCNQTRRLFVNLNKKKQKKKQKNDEKKLIISINDYVCLFVLNVLLSIEADSGDSFESGGIVRNWTGSVEILLLFF